MDDKSDLKRRHFIIYFIIGMIITAITLTALDSDMQITRYSIKSDNLPAEFDNFKIAQISDLHASLNPFILDALRDNQPDAIMFTGDTIDEYTQNLPDVLDFLDDCGQIAPCFYVTGNHEQWISDWDSISNQIAERGVIMLDEGTASYTIGDSRIYFTGIADPSFIGEEQARLKLQSSLSKSRKPDGYTVLLYHRADMLDCLSDSGYDLILSGHLHGGQIRIPFVGGIISPTGQWMPDYSGGRYKLSDQTTAVVSRGLSNPKLIPRIYNKLQLIFITLKSGD